MPEAPGRLCYNFHKVAIFFFFFTGIVVKTGKVCKKSEQILSKLLANPGKSRYTNTARFDGCFIMPKQTYAWRTALP